MRLVVLCFLVMVMQIGWSDALGAPFPQSDAPSSAKKQPPWKPGVVKGLTVGTSLREDMLRLLGNPTSQWTYEGREEGDPLSVTHFIYKDGAELPGDLTVDVVTGTGEIVRMSIESDRITLERAIQHFGPGYERVRYEWCPGGHDDVWILECPLYESPDGSMEYIEYRARGIAIYVTGSGLINEVQFVGTDGVGFTSTVDCARQLEEDRRSSR